MEMTQWRGGSGQSSDFDEAYVSSSGGGTSYSHNTYHGSTKHQRPPLPAALGSSSNVPSPMHLMTLQKPLRFTDSPQHYINAGSSNIPATAPRRKSSSTSNDGSDNYSTAIAQTYRKDLGYNAFERVPGIYIPGEYHNIPPSNDHGHYSNYSSRTDGLRTETNLAFNYSSEFNSRNEFYNNSEYYQTGFDPQPPSSEYQSGGYENPNTWTPVRFLHRRTPSNVSNASSTNTNNSNVNPTFRLDDDIDYPGQTSAFNTPTHYFPRRLSNTEHEFVPRDYYSRQNSHESNGVTERPATLEFGVAKLRSSLKRTNYQHQSGGSSSKCSPDTPPDSYTSDDASFVSARGDSTHSARVRFSPETMLLDLSNSSPHSPHEIMVPISNSRKSSTPGTPATNNSNELEREYVL